VDISRIKCVEVVKSDGIIPCQNKYPFQVCPFYIKYSALFNSTKPLGCDWLETAAASEHWVCSLALGLLGRGGQDW